MTPAERISLKFQNNTIDVGLYLVDTQCYINLFEGRNDIHKTNITGNHLTLKFQNNTVSEALTLSDTIITMQVYEYR